MTLKGHCKGFVFKCIKTGWLRTCNQNKLAYYVSSALYNLFVLMAKKGVSETLSPEPPARLHHGFNAEPIAPPDPHLHFHITL